MKKIKFLIPYRLFSSSLLIMLLLIGASASANQLQNGPGMNPIEPADSSAGEKSKKKSSDFKVYAGVSSSKIILSDSEIESAYAAGYLLGFAYRKGRFRYWEVGINYNNSAVTIEGVSLLSDNLQIRQVELPLTVGVNLLSLSRRVLGLRLFGGVVPGVIADISSNPFNLTEDDFNRFQFAGRAGFGVDITFLFVEAGYQYGFVDLLNEQSSNLGQFDFRLGFRF